MAMTLRLSAAETTALREAAHREGRSMQEVARTAIAQYTAERSRRRAEHLATIVAQDARLLERLGSE